MKCFERVAMMVNRQYRRVGVHAHFETQCIENLGDEIAVRQARFLAETILALSLPNDGFNALETSVYPLAVPKI